ncbi:hypothetical protein V7S43_017415 [Phytophthora oleae]|uniref:Uncharacterized protein n=1 Tax=Phytophthora oleae TaxID=2107226 RepID=A0ABD3EWE3_9STRA
MFELDRLRNVEAVVIEELPESHQCTRPESLTSLLPSWTIARCDSAVCVLQGQRAGLGEASVAVDIQGVGVFTTSTIPIMKEWHRILVAVQMIEIAVAWVQSSLFASSPVTATLKCRLKALPFTSRKIHLLDVAGNGSLSDRSMVAVMDAIFAGHEEIIYVDPALVSLVVNGRAQSNEEVKKVLVAVKSKKVVISVNVQGHSVEF